MHGMNVVMAMYWNNSLAQWKSTIPTTIKQLNLCTNQCRNITSRGRLFGRQFIRPRSLLPSKQSSPSLDTTAINQLNESNQLHNINQINDSHVDQVNDSNVFTAIYGKKQLLSERGHASIKSDVYNYVSSFGGRILPGGAVVYSGELDDDDKQQFDIQYNHNTTKQSRKSITSPSSTTSDGTTTAESSDVIDPVDTDEPAQSFTGTDAIAGYDTHGNKLLHQQLVLNESDLIERYIKGGGKGGQKVNKSNNCVLLIHQPTNTYVKCHATRSLVQNRIIARKIMMNRLDELYNGKNSQSELIKQKYIKQKQKQYSRVKAKYGHNQTIDNCDTIEHVDHVEDEIEARLLHHTVVDKHNKSLNKKLAKQLISINIPQTQQNIHNT